MHRTGELASLEPAKPIAVGTPIGRLIAYDPNAIGVNADVNSLKFDASGNITELITVRNRVAVQTSDGHLKLFRPIERISPLDDESTISIGLIITFGLDCVTFTESGKTPQTFTLSDCSFTVTKTANRDYTCSPADCASCSKCGEVYGLHT
jgi:hypothetical protein